MIANFDVAPDGKSIVAVIDSAAQPARDEVTLVVNFVDELRRAVAE